MKQTLKKLRNIVLMGMCVFALTACGSSKQDDTLPLDKTMEKSFMEYGQGLAQAVSQMTDENIATYLKGTDVFSASAAMSWRDSRDDLGAYVEPVQGEGKVEVKDDFYLITVVAKFEKRNAEVSIMMNKDMQPTNYSLNPVFTMGEKMQQAGLNTLMGLGIVFVMLVFLSFIISLMKFIPAFVDSFGKKKEAPAPAVKAEEVPVAEAEEVIDDGELIAVIAAAIAASENTSTDSFVVRSIRKSNKRNWQRA